MNKKALSILVLTILVVSPLMMAGNNSVMAKPNNTTITPQQAQYETGGTLKLALGWWPDLLNPVSSETAYDWELLGYIFEGLTGSNPFDMQNTSKDLGWLAESWTREIKYNVNASELLGTNATEYFGDGLPEVRNVSVWHVQLRQNVTWQDGESFTADDVVFTYKFINWTQSDQWYEVYTSTLYVNKTGDYSVDIWAKDDGFFTALQALGVVILPEHIYGNAQTWGENYAGTFPNWNVTTDVVLGYKPKSATDPILTGTGPFKLVAWYPTTPDPSLADTFVLRRYTGYYFRALDQDGNEIVPWEDAQINETHMDQHGPYIDELHYIVTTDPAVTYDRLRAGIIDMAAEFEFGFYVSELQSLGFKIETKDRLGFGHVTVNSGGYSARNATTYAQVRRAIAYAIDKYEITTRAWAGYARPIDLPVPPAMGIWSIEDSLAEHYYDANPTKALQLLEAVGIKDYDNDGWLEWDSNDPNSELTLVFTGTSSATVQIIMDVVKESLEDIGIHLDIRTMNFNALVDSWFSGQFDLTFFGWSLGRFPTILQLWTSSHPYDQLIYRWYNTTYDEYVSEMMTAETLNDAIQWAHKAEEIIYYEQPIIPVYQNLIPGAYKPSDWQGVYSILGAPVVNFWTVMKVVKKKAVTVPWSIESVDYTKVALAGGSVDVAISLNLTGTNLNVSDMTVEVLYWYSGESSATVTATYNGVLEQWIASIPVGAAGIFYIRPKVTDKDGNTVYGDAHEILIYKITDVVYPPQITKGETATIKVEIESPFDYNYWMYLDPDAVTLVYNTSSGWVETSMTYDATSGYWTATFTGNEEGLVYFYFIVTDYYGANNATTGMYNLGVGVPPLPTILSVNAPTEAYVNEEVTIEATIQVAETLSVTVTLIWWYENDTTNNTVTMTKSGNVWSATITPDKEGTIHYVIKVVDSEGRTVTSSEGTITITKAPAPPAPGISPMVVAGIVVGFIIIIGALVFFLRKRE
ncbi:MAG: maltotransferase domain-containing protein [Candidatus Njordarchaeia archaeon]